MREEHLNRYLLISLGGHLFFIVILAIRFFLFPDKPIQYIPTLRVDMVALPDILKKDLYKIPPKQQEKTESEPVPEAKPEVKTKPTPSPDEVVLKTQKKTEADRKRKMSQALDRIKSLQKLKEPNVIVKGNTLSPGNTVTGEAQEAAEATYFDILHDALQANWVLPVWLARQELSARVRIYLNPNGTVRTFVFQKASGHPVFDEAVKSTIEKSQPFPVPPEDLADKFEYDGILIGFPL